MKITLYFILIPLTFVTIAFIPNSLAGESDLPKQLQELERPIVKVIYFIPKDRSPQPSIDEKLVSQVKKAQKLIADLMEAQGFDRKTFQLEEDAEGEVVVHHRWGSNSDIYYRENVFSLWYEFPEDSDLSKDYYIVFFETDTQRPDTLPWCGLGFNATEYKGGLVPSSGKCFEGEHGVDVITHELAHGFELAHDDRTNADAKRIYLNTIDPMLTSYCAAAWLDRLPVFNTSSTLLNQNTTVKMFEPELASPPYNIRLRFEISDPDGIHMVKLLSIESDEDLKLRNCKELNGVSEITTGFETNQLPPYTDTIVLRMLDVLGNYKQQEFKLSEPLPFPPAQDLDVPDPNLADAIRKQIGEAITTHSFFYLTELNVNNKRIKDLTGLEHAQNLLHLSLFQNEISDVSPLSKLRKLKVLNIGHNDISDISPLSELTQLQILLLSFNTVSEISPITELTQLINVHFHNNAITDVSPLAELTQLRILKLSNNRISNVKPLAKLVNLIRLDLVGNPINSQKPLLDLLRKNPNIKIYLKNFRETLPVTMSYFHAEHTDAGVVLKWITESEVDNAGFYIYRSETKDGQYRAINTTMIQGAGTTGERNEYTWTDTTAKLNTVYYYRIEDISHAGVREQLATVRLRGLVSASGKLTTRWSDLKVK